MIKHACQYKIVRFAPYAETGEFANIGIVLLYPASPRLEFQLAKPRFARVTHFFEELDPDTYRQVIYGLRDEFTRIQKLLAREDKQSAQQIFTELTQTKGGIVRYSDQRVILTEDIDAQMQQLFAHYVGRRFSTPQHGEQLLEQVVKNRLKQLNLERTYKKASLNAGLYEIPMPFVRQVDGKNLGVIKPLAFDQKKNGKAVEHADLWLNRAEHLLENSVGPDNLLFAIDVSQTEDSQVRNYIGHFRTKLEHRGIHTADADDIRAITDFAQRH